MKGQFFLLKSAAFITLCCFSLSSVPAAGYPVFDVSNWLTAIDELYVAYDQIMNTIKQIEQGYEQLQHAYEEAKSWEFENIQWDGDWDFRNEIHSAVSSVNRQLNNLRIIDEVLTVKRYTMGSGSYTLKDLVGLGDSDKDIFDAAGSVIRNSYDSAVYAWTNELTDKQKMAIWRKYGLSPKNYKYMQTKKAQLKSLSDTIIASGTDEAVRLQTEAVTELTNGIVSSALEGEQTEKELLQKQILLIGELLNQLNGLGIKIDRASAQSAWKNALEEQLAQAELEAQKAMEQKSSHPGALFMY
jgi:hypothetical protein